MAFNFNEMQNAHEFTGNNFPRPQAGGYVMRVIGAEDNTQKQYYKLIMDYTAGEFANYGNNMEQRTGWQTGYIVDYASYKPTALGMMKYRCKMFSDANSSFDSQRAAASAKEFLGKVIGVILQEEEYIKKNNTIGTRLRVYSFCSLEDIQRGNFKVPNKKLLTQTNTTTNNINYTDNINYDELPF